MMDNLNRTKVTPLMYKEQNRKVQELLDSMNMAEKELEQSKAVSYDGHYPSAFWLVWFPFLVSGASACWLVTDSLLLFIVLIVAILIIGLFASVALKHKYDKQMEVIYSNIRKKQDYYNEIRTNYYKEKGILYYYDGALKRAEIKNKKQNASLPNDSNPHTENTVESSIGDENKSQGSNRKKQLNISTNRKKKSLKILDTDPNGIKAGDYLRHSSKGLCQVLRIGEDEIEICLLMFDNKIIKCQYPQSIGTHLFKISEKEFRKLSSELSQYNDMEEKSDSSPSDIDAEKAPKSPVNIDYSKIVVGTRVNNCRYGDGIVVERDGNYIYVEFGEDNPIRKQFDIPFAFSEGYLSIIDIKS